MTSLLENAIKAQVASAFSGKLLSGTLRRVTGTAVDAFGDPTTTAVTTYTFEGTRDDRSAFFRASAGIPDTDVLILIIAGSFKASGVTTTVRPKTDDQIYIRNTWHQVRRIVEEDPASATFLIQTYEIEDPT